METGVVGLRGETLSLWPGCVQANLLLSQVRDSLAAAAHGLPGMFNLQQCSVPALTMDDFTEEETATPTERSYPYSPEEMQYYIQEIVLCDLLGVVVSTQYPKMLHGYERSTLLEAEPTQALDYDARVPTRENDISETDVDHLLQKWYFNIPPELDYDVNDVSKHRFLPAYIRIIFW